MALSAYSKNVLLFLDTVFKFHVFHLLFFIVHILEGRADDKPFLIWYF